MSWTQISDGHSRHHDMSKLKEHHIEDKIKGMTKDFIHEIVDEIAEHHGIVDEVIIVDIKERFHDVSCDFIEILFEEVDGSLDHHGYHERGRGGYRYGERRGRRGRSRGRMR